MRQLNPSARQQSEASKLWVVPVSFNESASVSRVVDFQARRTLLPSGSGIVYAIDARRQPSRPTSSSSWPSSSAKPCTTSDDKPISMCTQRLREPTEDGPSAREARASRSISKRATYVTSGSGSSSAAASQPSKLASSSPSLGGSRSAQPSTSRSIRSSSALPSCTGGNES
eukprot:3241329-Prymnesium_polylepis.2